MFMLFFWICDGGKWSILVPERMIMYHHPYSTGEWVEIAIISCWNQELKWLVSYGIVILMYLSMFNRLLPSCDISKSGITGGAGWRDLPSSWNSIIWQAEKACSIVKALAAHTMAVILLVPVSFNRVELIDAFPRATWCSREAVLLLFCFGFGHSSTIRPGSPQL